MWVHVRCLSLNMATSSVTETRCRKKLARRRSLAPTLDRVRHRLAYELLKDPPHIPARLLKVRFDAKLAPPDESGCRIWRGAVRKRGDNAPEVGTMRLKAPDGSLMVTAPQVAWFLAGRGWVDKDTYLNRRCGQALCCEASHLLPQAKVDRRKLSVDQVLECRELYWNQKRFARHLNATSPAHLAGRKLGIAAETVGRVIAGEKVSPGSWRNWELTVEEVHAAVEDARRMIDDMRRDREAAWTLKRLGSRYGVTESIACQIVSGYLYKDAGGPTSAREAREEASRAAFAEARRARQAAQGDPAILARQARVG